MTNVGFDPQPVPSATRRQSHRRRLRVLTLASIVLLLGVESPEHTAAGRLDRPARGSPRAVPILLDGARGRVDLESWSGAEPRLPGPDLGVPAPETPSQDTPFAAVDACLRAEMQDKGIHGASMAIAMDGVLVHATAFGIRSVGSTQPVDTETIFRINSTTKMMAAAAVMQQVEAGRLDLHAPITHYVPELVLEAPWEPGSLTLHALLANAGALPDPYLDYSQMPRRYVMVDGDVDLSAWARSLATMHLYAPPGTFWNYSSPNFSLAALPVERVSGQSFADYVTEHLWRPAGMRRATFDPAAVISSGNYAVGHVGGVFYGEPDRYQRTHALPGGGAYSTPSELVAWALQLTPHGGHVLTPASVRAMTTPYFEAEDVPWTPRSSYGYGIFIEDFRAIDDPSRVLQVMRHPGNGRGYGTELVWVPELGFVIATLINDHNTMQRTVDCALRRLARLEPVPIRGLRTAPSSWGPYTGTYAIRDIYGARWTGHVSLRGNEMRMQLTDWTLVPTIAATLADGAVMQQRNLDTFSYAYAGNQTVTFEAGGTGAEQAGWLRNRYFVGQRVGELPERLDIEGRGCAALALTAGRDTAALRARAYGLNEVRTWRDEAVLADDPLDPSTSAIRIDIETNGPLGFLTAWLFSEADDTLGMYLMQDQDGDGRFAWPDELVERLTSASAQGIFVPAREAPGAYQLWIHGEHVQGTGSVFDLDLVAISGDALRIEGLPTAMEAGQPTSFEVCAAPGPSYGSARAGILELDFGAPGAVARVPVFWAPGETPEPPRGTLYLPWLRR